MSLIYESHQAVIAPPRQTYSFPNLKTHDIILCLKELGINVSEDDLSHPEKDKEQIRRMFEHLTEVCTGISRDEMNQPAFSGLSVLEYPELHEDSIPQINSFRACQKLMDTCGIKDFTIKDFIEPNAKRLRKQLSGVMNFAKFREERLNLFTDLTNKRIGLQEKLRMLKQENVENTNKLALMREQTADEETEIQKTDKECKELESDVLALNHQQAEIREESSVLKNENNQLKDEIAAKSLQQDELTASKKKLQNQIVNSPERFRKQIHDVEQSLATEQQETQNMQRKHREVSAWLSIMEEVQGEIDSANDALGDVKVESEKQKSITSEIESTRGEEANRRQVLGDLDENISQMNRQIGRLDDKLQGLRKQASSRTTENESAIETFSQQLLEAENARIEMRSRSERLESDASRIERENEAERAEQEADLVRIQELYKKSESVVITHLQSLRSKIEGDSSENTKPLPTNCV